MKSGGGEREITVKLFSLFRGKNPENQPTEVQDYYRTQQSERKGVAWLLAFATFLVTLVVILGMFFGGKWAYRKLADRDKASTTQATKPQSTDSTSQSNSDDSSSTQKESASEQTDVGTSADEPPQTSSTRTDTPSSAVVPNTGPTELIQTGEDYPY